MPSLRFETLTRACAQRDAPYQNDSGAYELEGELSELELPTNLSDSIRLRLAMVRDRDSDLDWLLKLVVVMGGTFTMSAVACVWGVLPGVSAAVSNAIQRAVSQRFLKFLTSSGNTHTDGARRRSSAVGDAAGRWTLQHGRIGDSVTELLLAADARMLHDACAKTLGHGLVEIGQLAVHNEQAGHHVAAAQLFVAAVREIRAQGGRTLLQAASARRALLAARQDQAVGADAERVEAQAAFLLLTTWTCSAEELNREFARVKMLREGPARDAINSLEYTTALFSRLFRFAERASGWWSGERLTLEQLQANQDDAVLMASVAKECKESGGNGGPAVLVTPLAHTHTRARMCVRAHRLPARLRKTNP